MSTEQVDPQLVEETKQQIRDLVNEIADLARSEVSPEEFYNKFLTRVVAALAAEGGAVWTTGDGNRIELAYQIDFVKTNLADDKEAQAQHGKLLGKVLSTGEPLMIPPRSGASEDSDEGGNPTDYLLILGPLMSDQEIKGVVEIFQRPGARPTTQRGYMRFLMQMCDIAGDYLKTRSLRHFGDRQLLWNQLEIFTRLVHKTLDPRETAYTIANEGRRLIQCDRVSVAILRGRKCKIEAVSGQDTFDKRSNTIRMLGKLATAVVATGETVWYTGDTSDMAPQVEDALQNYVDESHSKTVGILPLKRPKDYDKANPNEEDPPEVIGALIIEQIEDAKLREGTLQRVDVVSEHSAGALANAQEHNNLFLMPVWRTIGKATWVVRAKTLPKTLSIAAVVVAVVASLIIIPTDFYMEGSGELQPAIQREVFSPPDGGTVVEVLVKHEQAVQAGDLLLRLENKDLEYALQGIMKEINDSRNQALAKDREIRAEKDPRREALLHGELLEILAPLESYQAQRKLIEEKLAALEVKSPIDGIVLTWDVKNRLLHRPVEPGQIVMTVANPSGNWELAVNMPEDKMGPVDAAQVEFDEKKAELEERRNGATPEALKQIDAALEELGPGLKVSYIVLTDPGRSLEGSVEEIHIRADVRGDEGNTVRIRVAIDKDDPEELLPGATVKARIYCGRRAVGYVWFRDIGNWVNREVLFPLGF